jgi:hypothetical protein
MSIDWANGELDEVVDDLGTVRGFVARFLELGAYGLIALADNLRPGLAAAMAIDLLKIQGITVRVIPSPRGEADAGCQQPPAPLPPRTTEIDR